MRFCHVSLIGVGWCEGAEFSDLRISGYLQVVSRLVRGFGLMGVH